MLWHGSNGQLNGVWITWVRILLSSLCCHLAPTSAGREAGLNSIRNLVEEAGAAAVTAIGGVGTDLIAAVTAVATAVAISADFGPGAGAAAGAAGPGGTAGGGPGAGPKPAAESTMSVPHCR